MDHLDRFRGNYDVKKQRLERCRDMLIATAKQFIPENFEELLAANEDGEIDVPLDWVTVPDPSTRNDLKNLEIQPVVGLWVGEDDKKFIPAGLSSLTLVGKLPNGEDAVIGTINAIGGGYKPSLFLNYSADLMASNYTSWETADAELFLNLAESVMQAQSI